MSYIFRYDVAKAFFHKAGTYHVIHNPSCIVRSCTVTMIICNEAVATGIGRLPTTVETALRDLKDYRADTTSQLRKCLTRSLDVASEAILADLDGE